MFQLGTKLVWTINVDVFCLPKCALFVVRKLRSSLSLLGNRSCHPTTRQDAVRYFAKRRKNLRPQEAQPRPSPVTARIVKQVGNPKAHLRGFLVRARSLPLAKLRGWPRWHSKYMSGYAVGRYRRLAKGAKSLEPNQGSPLHRELRSADIRTL